MYPMREYHETESGAMGAHESIKPRHPSIVVITPPVTSEPLIWTAESDDLFCRFIDALPSTAAQHCAAVIYDLLHDYTQQRVITSACRIPMALIAGVAGYSKAAMWRSLPIIARAGLLSWENAGHGDVAVQLAPPDLTNPPPAPVAPPFGVAPSTIPPALHALSAHGYLALGIESNERQITLLRGREEPSQ
jgi:hypothetical protein